MQEETSEQAGSGDRYEELRKENLISSLNDDSNFKPVNPTQSSPPVTQSLEPMQIPMEVVQQPSLVKDPMGQLNMPPASLNQIENEMDVDEEGVEEEKMVAEEQQKEENPIDTPIACRSIRIGSFKVHPKRNNTTFPVFLSMDAISFSAPTVLDANKVINITLKPSDVTQMWVHFGPCLLLVFITTTTNFTEALRRSLNMSVKFFGYYDPTSSDEKQKRITFLIDSLKEEHCDLLQNRFMNSGNIRELDQKTANKILVKSTIFQFDVQLLTYPSAPKLHLTDVVHLKEGELLNDSIIEFYLTFIHKEKLSEYDQQKTDIFSSFFVTSLIEAYNRVPKKCQADDTPESHKKAWFKRVNHWTKKRTIFSKDFLIIPVNQHKHWYLIIICYPGLVPEALEASDDQEENKLVKEASSTVDGNNQNSDENSTLSNMFETRNLCEEPMPEASDSSKHPDKIRHKKEVPCICIFDSLNRASSASIIPMLRDYLEMEWENKMKTRKEFTETLMPLHRLECPQQKNGYDCGVYMLQYFESFFESPIPYFDSPMPSLKNWFPEERITKKREELCQLISSLQKEHPPTNQESICASGTFSSQAQVLQNNKK